MVLGPFTSSHCSLCYPPTIAIQISFGLFSSSSRSPSTSSAGGGSGDASSAVVATVAEENCFLCFYFSNVHIFISCGH